MREINLNKSKVAIVDDDNYEYLSSFKWHVTSAGYACRKEVVGGKAKYILMHREIMGVGYEKRTVVVDHINQDILNNQKYNMRITTTQKNAFNKQARKNTSSQYKGVCWDKSYRKWRADIRPSRKNVFLGRFENEVDAAIAYNVAAKEIYGEFAWLNEIPT